MKKIQYIVLICALSISLSFTAKAQSYGVRTNIAAWATQTANLGVDFVLSETTTLHFTAYKTVGISWFKDLNATALQAEYRYWFAHQPMQDFFVGFTATPAHYKMVVDGRMHKGIKTDVLHDGFAIPCGINIGYSWPLIDRLNLEVAAGTGMVFYTDRAVQLVRTKHELTFSTTNLMIGFTYILK